MADRFKANFAKKHDQLQTMWDDCPEADLAMTMMRIDENIRFDKAFAKKAIHQITNGYKTILEAMTLSGCPKTNRYSRMVCSYISKWPHKHQHFLSLDLTVLRLEKLSYVKNNVHQLKNPVMSINKSFRYLELEILQAVNVQLVFKI